MTQENLKVFRKSRATVKGSVTRIEAFLKSNKPVSIFDLESRQGKLEECYTEFKNLQNQIELIEDDSEGNFETAHEKERDSFENQYYDCVSLIKQKLHELKEQNSAVVPNNRTSEVTQVNHANLVQPNSLLPRIKIQPFDGNPIEWRSFKNTFKSVVHDVPSISSAHKFQLLKANLRGDIASILDSLDESEEDYKIAWELITKRCEKPRVIINSHIQALFDIAPIGKESPSKLRALRETLQKHVNAVKLLKDQCDPLNAILVYIVTSKLDKVTRRAWDRTQNDDAKPDFDELITFISQYERGDDHEIISNNAKSSNNTKGQTSRAQTLIGTQRKIECVFCKGTHNLFTCSEFFKLTPRDRSEHVRKNKLCLNCLRDNHFTNKCRTSGCKICNRKHNTLLHFQNVMQSSDRSSMRNASSQLVINKNELNANDGDNSTTESEKLSYTVTNDSEVLLGTAKIKILDINNKEHVCRVLLDSGSQTNFITENFATKLQLHKTKINAPFAGLAQIKTTANYMIETKVKSRVNGFEKRVKFIALPTITGFLPSQSIDKTSLNLPKNIPLADVDFHKPAAIDALLGATVYYQLLCNGQIRLTENDGIILQKTLFGWIVAGETHTRNSNKQIKCHLVTELDDQLQRFWEIEEIDAKVKYYSKEETECESFYKNTTRRESNGRYTVRLPFNTKFNQLGESYNMALRRYLALERKLKRNPNLHKMYDEFLKEYAKLKHMENVTETHIKQEGYYIPHHAVIKETNDSIKLRVVFDASAKTTTNISLNNSLMVGPTVQPDLVTIILKFRCHNVVMTADIKQMYRQVNVNHEDANFQKIIWRPQSTNEIKVFKLTTVTQGTASAPFSATRTLLQLANDEIDKYPEAAKILKNDFYVDDLLTGATNVNEMKKLKRQLIEILNSGGFELHKWKSNKVELLENLNNTSTNIINLDRQEHKLLGIQWNSKQDNLSYAIHENKTIKTITKRIILSRIAQLFDPLGLLGPVITRAKVIMQRLWRLKIDWDESVPQDLHGNWSSFENELKYLERFTVPRQSTIANAIDIQLHGFCDASEMAYGACVYLRSTNNKNQTYVNLICAKSRVAPIKLIKLPRLELCAAVLLSKLVKFVKNCLNLNFSKINLWSDSTIVLHQIKRSPHLLKTFVANRVASIQSLTCAEDWQHIAGDKNPADEISRGQTPCEFLNNKIWLKGPTWLSYDENKWKKCKLSSVEIPDKKKPKPLAAINTKNEIFEKYSSITKLNRVVALCWRLREKAKYKENLTVRELDNAHMLIIKIIQQVHFSKEIKLLSKNEPLKAKSKLLCLSPFLDNQGIIRVGGRLTNTNLSYARKYPILLPHNDHITILIIRNVHETRWHAGVASTLNEVRNTYWPIDGTTTTRSVIKKCIRCCKFQPKLSNYKMGELPDCRVLQSRPFHTVGIDYCGPFLIKEKKFRNTKKLKAYVVVFVCFVSKAVHLELVTDLTTDTCMEAIKRFVTRRGKPGHIFSDNATNFVGVKNEILKIRAFIVSHENNTIFNKYCQGEGIQWHFSPPRSPHFGGLWEAAVKAFKIHFLKVIGQTLMTYEHFNTLIIQVEAILNSRPLTPLSNDPNDLHALTPFHFIIGEFARTVPEYEYTKIETNRLSTWQHIQKIKQDFWQRWSKEYLNELRTRSKWHMGDDTQIKIGTLVTIKDDNIHPMNWKLGRITTVHPGEDNITRVATVKTADGEYKRSLKKLAPLPIET